MNASASNLTVFARGDTPSAAAAAPPRRRWSRLALPAVILIGAAAVLAYTGRDALLPQTPVRVVPVVVKSGVAGVSAGVAVQAPGWVEAAPFATAVSALADGVVKEVVVLEGQPVAAGDVVARLVDDDAKLSVAAAEAELAERRAAIQAAEALLEEAQREWDNPVELTRAVAAAQAELAERRGELARWPAELATEEARAAELEAEYRRIEPLHASGAASEIELIRAQKQYESHRALCAATAAREPILKAQIAAAEAELVAAQENLRLRIPETRRLAEAKAGLLAAGAAEARAAAMLAEARLRLERMEVRAPVGGIVMNRLVAPGSKVMLRSEMATGAQIARLYDPQQLQVRADVPLGEVAHVGVGQRAEVVVSVLPDRMFQGVVTRVVHEADIQKNTLQVKVQIENPTPDIKPEMLARVRFRPAERTDDAPEALAAMRVFAPDVLLSRHGPNEAHTWIVDRGRSTAQRRNVTLGTARLDGWIEVLHGLQPGDRLIADDPNRLRDGQRVRVVGEQAELASAHGGH